MVKKAFIYALLIITFIGISDWNIPTQEQINHSYDELNKLSTNELFIMIKKLSETENYAYTNAIQILCEKGYEDFTDLIDYHLNNYSEKNRIQQRFVSFLLADLIEIPIFYKFKNNPIVYHKELLTERNRYTPILKNKGIPVLISDRTEIDSFTDKELLEIGYTEEWIYKYRQNQKQNSEEQNKINDIKKLPDDAFIDNWLKYHYILRKDITNKNFRNSQWAGPMNDIEFYNRGLDYYSSIEEYYEKTKLEDDEEFVNFIEDCIANRAYVNSRVDSLSAVNKKRMETKQNELNQRYNPNPVLTNEKKTRFVRAEDAGVSFKDTTKAVLLERLQNSTDRIELQKVSRVLGDRFIANTLELTEPEKKNIYDAVVKFINYQDSDVGETREEGRFNIHRLWRLAVPALIDNLHNDNIRKKELAAKCLLFMKNEEIVQKIIELAEKEKDPEMKKKLIFVLNKVEKVVKTTVPDRKSIDESESKALYEKIVKPALDRLEKKKE